MAHEVIRQLMPSLKKLNAAAGTKFTRWKQVVGVLKEEPMAELTDAQRRRVKAQIDEEKRRMAEPVKVAVSDGANAEYHADKFVLYFDDTADHTRVLTMDGERFKGETYFAEKSPMTINYGWPDDYKPTHDPPFWHDYGPVTSWKLYCMEDPKGHFRHGIVQWYPKDAVQVYEGEIIKAEKECYESTQ